MRNRGREWSMRFGVRVAAVLAAVAIANVSAAAAYAAQPGGTPTGNDVSYPADPRRNHHYHPMEDHDN
jgi:hypothetical protein